jgi:hypothetical protein
MPGNRPFIQAFLSYLTRAIAGQVSVILVPGQVNAVLRALNRPETGSLEERKKRLCFAIGLTAL